MNRAKIVPLFLSLAAIGLIVGALILFKEENLSHLDAHHHRIAQNTNIYLGPNQKLPGNPELIRVQILVYNDPDPKGVEIVSIEFDGTPIPLKPRDIYGFRGQASFQKSAGSYKLKWKVNRDKQTWPRTLEHEENVILDARDLWIQIAVIGNIAEIS